MRPLATPASRKAARELRRCSTDSERYLWLALRNRTLGGMKFRRQHPIGPYVLDFYCHGLSLAIEIDGPYHDFTSERDLHPQGELEAMGIRFIHVLAEDVEKQRDAVVGYIRSRIAALRTLTPTPSPTSRERGGQRATAGPHSGLTVNSRPADDLSLGQRPGRR